MLAEEEDNGATLFSCILIADVGCPVAEEVLDDGACDGE